MSVADVLNDLVSAVDAACEVDPGLVGDGETLVALHRQLARLEAVTTRAAAAFDAGGSWEPDGVRSAASWVTVRCGVPASTARRRVGLGRALRHMPHTEAAWGAGEIDDAHAAPLAAARTPVTASAFEPDEAMLVGQAKGLTHAQFVRALAYWCQLADPDGVEARAAALHDARRVHLSGGFGGMWFLDGVLDPIGGTAVAEALRRIEAELFEADWAAARARVGDGVTVSELARTPAQRRAAPWWRWPGGRGRCPPAPACPSRGSACWWAMRPSPGASASWPTAPWSAPGACCGGWRRRGWSGWSSTGPTG